MKKTIIITTAALAVTCFTNAASLINVAGVTSSALANGDGPVTGVIDGNTVEGWRNNGAYDSANPAGAFPGVGVVRPSGHQRNHFATENALSTSLTFDLGSAYNIEQINVLNTSNTAWNDRETDTFTIQYSTDGVNFDSESSSVSLQNYTAGFQEVPYEAIGATHVRLNLVNDPNINVGELQPGNPAGDAAVGLNEVQFIGTVVPEPSSVLLGVLSALCLVRRRR